jgi:hypothetical protein
MTNTSNFGTIFRIRDDRQAKALTGCTLAMLRELLPVFGQLFNDGLMAHRPVRSDVKQRIVGGGKKGVLRTTEDKLVYVLLYLKAYPTYDVLSSIFDSYYPYWKLHLVGRSYYPSVRLQASKSSTRNSRKRKMYW